MAAMMASPCFQGSNAVRNFFSLPIISIMARQDNNTLSRRKCYAAAITCQRRTSRLDQMGSRAYRGHAHQAQCRAEFYRHHCAGSSSEFTLHIGWPNWRSEEHTSELQS